MSNLIGAPIPRGYDGQSKGESRPRQVTVHRIPEHVEGIVPRDSAKVVTGRADLRDRLKVLLLQSAVTADLVESWK